MYKCLISEKLIILKGTAEEIQSKYAENEVNALWKDAEHDKFCQNFQ